MKKKVITTLSLLCVTLLSVPAIAQTNLLFDGGMEQGLSWKPTQPRYWNFKSSLATWELSKDQKCPESKGTMGLKVIPSEDAMMLWNRDQNDSEGGIDYPLALEVGKEYKFSAWIKSKHGKGKIQPVIRMGKSKFSAIRSLEPVKIGAEITPTTQWKKYEGTVTLKAHNDYKNNAQFAFLFDEKTAFWAGGYEEFYIDDVMLYSDQESGESEIQATLETPTEIKTDSYQREIELSWKQPKPNTVDHWELYIEGKSEQPIIIKDQPKVIIDNLIPGKEYQFKLRAVKGEEFSKKVDLKVKTNAITIGVDDPMRTPYLRAITMTGEVQKKLPLYFYDLYGEHPKITCLVDDQPAKVENNHILFNWNQPKDSHFQPHTVTIKIEESNGHTFTLTYYLTVTDAERKFQID